MARARNIKPGFFQNEDIVELSFADRLLFIGLWTLADREGRLEDRPKRIKMSLFPADEIDIEKGISELVRYGFARRYEVSGKPYIQIVSFAKHQRPHHQEKASEIPPEPDLRTNPEINAPNPPDSLIPDSLNTERGLSDSEASATAPNASGDGMSFLLKDGTEFLISSSLQSEFRECYPELDFASEVREIRAWCKSNPAKRKTKSGAKKFINGWLSRSKNEISKQSGKAGFGGFDPYDDSWGDGIKVPVAGRPEVRQ